MSKIKCGLCHKENHKDNFICEHCGFHLDLKITYNELGLPEIEPL